MGRPGKEELSRRDGMAIAFQIVKEAQQRGEDPVEALRRKIERSGSTFRPAPLKDTEAHKFERQVKENCVATITAVTVMILHDNFEFTRKRQERFIWHFNNAAEKILEDSLEMSDVVGYVKRETGLDLKEYFKYKF